MKQMNNTCVEVLPAYLDKSKVQSIRKTWRTATQEEKAQIESGLNISVEIEGVTKDFMDYVCGDGKKQDYQIPKLPKYKVGDEVKVYWKKDSKYEWFCKGSGLPLTKNQIVCGEGCCSEDWCEKHYPNKIEYLQDGCKIFHKSLGTVKITEVFEIEMDNDYICSYLHNKKNNNVWFGGFSDEFAKKDGFKSSENMFKYFDKNYDLSSPKKFYVYRWKWLK